MNISKKQEKESEILDFMFFLQYHMRLTVEQMKFLTLEQIYSLCQVEKSNKCKNYWLQKRNKKLEEKEYEDKIEQVAKFVTKYISNIKSRN